MGCGTCSSTGGIFSYREKQHETTILFFCFPCVPQRTSGLPSVFRGCRPMLVLEGLTCDSPLNALPRRRTRPQKPNHQRFCDVKRDLFGV